MCDDALPVSDGRRGVLHLPHGAPGDTQEAEAKAAAEQGEEVGMTATDTATVETLRAEVRVLQVGNRQITTSVAKQLDVVKFREIEPFGRCRLSDGDWLIGSDRASGALVRASFGRLTRLVVRRDDLPEPVKVSRQWRYKRENWHKGDRSGWLSLQFGDLPAHFEQGAWCWADADGRLGAINSGPVVDALGKMLETFPVERDARIAAADLPLIVLAGLR